MSESWRFWGMVLLIVAVLVIISIILMRIFNQKKYISITPGITMLIISVILFIKGRFFSQALQDLGYYVMSMISFLASLVTLFITLIIIEISKPKKRGDIN